MPVLYVTEQGAKVIKREGRVQVRKNDQVLADLPITQLEQIVCFGSAHLTTPMMGHCLSEGIEVVFLSKRGRFKGKLTADTGKDVRLRQRQYEKGADLPFALSTAKAFVEGKVRNGIILLERQRTKLPEASRLNELRLIHRQVPIARDLDHLRGVEGNAARLYYELWGSLLPTAFPFAGRVHHPPPDPVNALLSLGYSLLYNAMHGAVSAAGLDPYMGCYHQPKHGHAALVSDLMEEFRPVVDGLVLGLLNRHEIRPEHFQLADGGVRLTKEGLANFLTRWDERIRQTVWYAPLKGQFPYRQVFHEQARQFARLVRGRIKTYTPFALPE